MFSALSGATRASASAASGAFGQDGAGGGSFQKRNRRRARPSDSNQNNSDRGGDSNIADRGDGARQNSKRGRPEKKGQNGSHRSGQRPGPKWQALHDAAGSEEALPNYSSTDESSPPPSRMTPPRSNDPFAKRIHDKLRKDGISPPRWPDRPGNASSSSEMAQFRELHEAYRRRARASLTKTGLIDDPEKRKRLSDAIEFKGICEDMCPEFEKITRITENDVNNPEKDRSTGVTRVRMMVKKLARSAAGQEAPLPMDVRSASALRRSLDYLIDEVLCHDENLSSVHPFLWDRTRAIRRDFAFFSSMTEEEVKTQVYVLENITRFHVTSLHLLSRPDQEDDNFVEQQELEQLGKTLLSLRDVYDDCGEQGIRCENEAEFRAYYLLFHGRDPSILETLQRQWRPDLWRDSDEVRTAVSLVEALQSTQEFIGSRKDGDAGPLLAASSAQLSYFRIVEDSSVSYTMACFAECHFPHLRRSILATVKRTLSRPKNPVQDVTTAALNEFLRFDTVEEAIQFAQLHNFDFVANEQNPADPGSQFVMLTDRSPLPHVRLSHHFSMSLVERKRGQTSLPRLIHSTVYENEDHLQGSDNLGEDEDNLFVRVDQESEDESSSENIATELGNSSTAAAPAQTPPSSPFKTRKVSPPKHPFVLESDTDDDDPPNGSTAPKPPLQSNPFAPKANPFGRPSESEPASTAQTPARRLAFEVKTMDTGNFVLDGSNSRYISPFGQPVGNKSAPEEAPKFAFASLAGTNIDKITRKRNPEEARTNPFAPQAASDEAMNGTEVSGNFNKPKPFGVMFGSSNGQPPQTADQVFGSGQAKPNPFASLSAPGSSAANPPADAPLGLSGAAGSSKSAEPPVSAAAFSQPNGAKANLGLGPFPSEQEASNQMTALPATAVNGQIGSLSPSAVASPMPLGAPPTTITSSASQTATSEGQGATNGSPTPVLGEQLQLPAAPGTIVTSTAASGVPTGSSGGKAADVATPTAHAPSTVAAEPVPAPPPRDLLGDVNKWYVRGDNGLLNDFLIDSISRITQKAFDAFKKEVKEQERLKEEERVNAEVERFRVYNLRLKFFYRWKRNARQKRLREVGRKGREEVRAFYEARRAAERDAKRAAAEARKRATAQDRSAELMNMLKSKRTSNREARESLLASCVLSGIAQEREAANMIVNDGSRSSRASSISSQSLEPSQAPVKEGSKTRALRKLYFGQPERFRRSLPAMSSSRDVPNDANRPSNASSRWTLKAMGIVQLPDGTAVPETLANEMASKIPRYQRSAASWTTRRVSATDAIEAELHRVTPSPSWRDASSMAAAGGSSPTNKRKKPSAQEEATVSGSAEESPSKRIMNSAERARAESAVEASSMNKRKRPAIDEETRDGSETDGNSHKRIMSDAEKIRSELRALRAELEEGTEWFRAQNERFRSESERTPWRDDSM